MSGIEIAGLVLGAIPVLISALDAYREGAESARDWWRIERSYNKCRNDLNFHGVVFEGNVERFLLPMVVGDDELRVLMDDPAGSRWEDPELEHRLKERLPKSYNLFLNTIEEILQLIDSLKAELRVSNRQFQARLVDGKLHKAGASRRDIMSMANMDFQVQRLKFSMRKSTRDRLFDKFDKANERMRKLLESNDQIAAARNRTDTQKIPTMLSRKMNEFWRHAKRLHEALSGAWQCNCASHIANLCLEHRTCDNIEFDVLFSLATTHQQLGWQGTRIKMMADNGVTINVPGSDTGSLASSQPQHGTAATQPLNSALDQTSLIRDLCSALSGSCPNCIGFLEADDHRFMLYSEGQAASLSDPATITLEQLLGNTQIMTRRRRYLLALILASSYLQLGATPWLDTRLRKGSIVFLQDPADPQVLDRPYICQELSKTGSAPSTDTLSSLGIRLLELCFSAPLESTTFRTRLPAGDETQAHFLDKAAANEWSELVSEEAGPEFAEAIKWCLRTEQRADGNWRKELWQNVIVPLDACHKQVSQKPPAVSF